MIVKNTTNIPTRLILHIAETIKPAGVDLPAEIKVRNKTEDLIHGNWGKFHILENRITVVLPQVIKNYSTRLKYSQFQVTLADRVEFLVLVLAHELQHSLQYKNGGLELMKKRNYIEVDAELYSIESLKKWRTYTSQLIAATGE